MATIRWGGRVFSSSAELARWLAQRGQSYASWAAKHPGAASQLDPGPARPPVQSYKDQIQNEGIFAAQNAQAAANTAASRSDANAAIAAGALDLGYVPEGVDIDPVARALAAKNPYSATALDARQTKREHGMNAADAAARGVISSGGYGLRAGDINFESGMRRFNALRDFMGIVSQNQRNIAETVQQGANDVYGNLGDATDRIMGSSFRPTASAATGQPATGASRPNVAGVTYAKDGFASAPAGGYANEADRQAVIAYNTALGRARPGVSKNGMQNLPGFYTAKPQWISYGKDSDRLTKIMERTGASGWQDVPGALKLNNKLATKPLVGKVRR